MELQIFDRWGEMVYYSEDQAEGWDGRYKGKLVQIDTYVWKVKVEEMNGDFHNAMGHVNVVR